MHPQPLWHTIEKRLPRAVQVNAEFIKSLVDHPSKHIVPKFDAATGHAIGIEATTPHNSSPLDVEVGDWLISHPTGDIERMDGYTFSEAYALRD